MYKSHDEHVTHVGVVLQELKLNPLNYSLYIPASGQGRMGKFMVDSHLLIDYALAGNVPKLEVSAWQPLILLNS